MKGKRRRCRQKKRLKTGVDFASSTLAVENKKASIRDCYKVIRGTPNDLTRLLDRPEQNVGIHY